MLHRSARLHASPHLGFLIESDGPGGAEQVVASLAEEFAHRGLQVSLFVPEDGEGWLRRRLHGTPVAVEDLPLGGPLSPVGIVTLVNALRYHRIELLHTHEFGQALNGAAATQLLGLPHLITMHGGRYYAGRFRRRAALRLAIARSGAVTAVSDELASALERDLRLSIGTVEVIPNGARPAPMGRPDHAVLPEVPVGVPLLLAVGNLYPVKGHRHLLEALALLRARHPEVHLAIAGRGAEEEALRAQAVDLGLSARVHFLGLRGDVGALLQRADLFVHPSLSEGLPLAVLEAMLAERPVVASAVGALPILLEGGAAGCLVPPEDPGALAATLDALLADPHAAHAVAERGARRARAEYTVARMADRYQALFDRLVAARAAA